MSEMVQWKAGSMFLSGSGVEEQKYRSIFYFDLSARSGYLRRRHKAKELYMEGAGIQRDRGREVLLLEEAVQRGDMEAKRLLFRARFSRMLLRNE